MAHSKERVYKNKYKVQIVYSDVGYNQVRTGLVVIVAVAAMAEPISWLKNLIFLYKF